MFETWAALQAEPARPFPSRFRSWERALWLVAALSLGSVGGMLAYGRIGEARALAQLEQRIVVPSPGAVPAAIVADGAVLGSLEVPRLDLHAVVLAGTAESTLLRGAGHVRGTALPGTDGNVVLAAHRDLHFRTLRNVRPGDLVRLRSASGERSYTVESSRIVLPVELSVLADDGEPRLTLITCYPFGWIGRAPRRFVVVAKQLPTAAS